ncbi:MAG: hypothetical protein P8099_04815 [Gemmatimonadota bacterium]
MRRLLTAIVLGSLVVGCASAGQARVEANQLPPCTTRPDLRDWHQVSGDGVTFCVPEDWSSTGTRAWHGDGGKIHWAWGVGTNGVTKRVRAVVAGGGKTPPRPPPVSVEASVPPFYSTTELVGGVQVDLWIIENDGMFETGARWNTGKPMHMTGEAPNRAAAGVQLDIYRSVRIVAQ